MNPEFGNISYLGDDLLEFDLLQNGQAITKLFEAAEIYSQTPSLEQELAMFEALQELNDQYDMVMEGISETDFSALEKITMLSTIRTGESEKITDEFNGIAFTDQLRPAGFVIACSEEYLEDIDDIQLLKIISGYFQRELDKQVGSFVTNFYYN